nr:WASH complex subunit 2C-like isoform X1 [Macaca nemestrina]
MVITCFLILESSSSKPGKKIPAGAVSVFLGDTDVFGAASVPSLKEPEKPEQPTPRKSPYVPPPTGLFDDDDDDDDFFSAPRSKPSKTVSSDIHESVTSFQQHMPHSV